jgi:hypothetical protein
MDADLSALYATATTIADKLAVLNAQTLRDSLGATKQLQADLLALNEQMLAQFNSPAELRRELAITLAANYMKPGTGTTLATQTVDATNDAQYFGVAIEKALAVIG